ncbi:MAG: hypothetical protein ACFFDN_15690 [Candidatus Hodarchaeota archaeon]
MGGEIKIKLPQVPKFYFKLLLLIGILLFIVFSIILPIIMSFTTKYLITNSDFLALLWFEPSFIIFLPEYMAIYALDKQLHQLSNLFSWIGILGIILIIISLILLQTYSNGE